jgi:hypothetical protein
MKPKGNKTTVIVTKKKKRSKSVGNNPVQVVVSTRPQRRTGRAKSTRVTSTPNLSNAYTLCLFDPCAAAAQGARVTDQYAIPTCVQHSKGRVTLSTVGTGMTSLDYVFIGRPLVTSWVSQSTSITASSYTGFSVNPAVQYAATPSALAAVFSSYRIVSSGIRIRCLMQPLSVTGRIIVARMPMPKVIPGPNMLSQVAGFLNPASGATLLTRLTGVIPETASPYLLPLNIIELPGAEEFTLSELEDAYIQVSNKPLSGKAFEFCVPTNGAVFDAAGDYTGQSGLISAAGAVNVASLDSLDNCMSDGWTCIVVRVEGLPSLTGTTPILDIETAIHLEGPPLVSNATQTTFVSGAVQVNSAPGSLVKALDAISRIPAVELINSGVRAANTIAAGYKAYKGAGVARAVGGLARLALTG